MTNTIQQSKTRFSQAVFQFSWLTLLLVTLCGGLLNNPSQAATSEYDHFSTGFPLTGEHRNVECDSCHDKGQFPAHRYYAMGVITILMQPVRR